MLDGKNVVNISGRLTADPEFPAENIVVFSIALDYAGSEKGTDSNTGFFNVKYFTSSDAPNAKWFKSAAKEGKVKKGSAVQILGSLRQERWGETGAKQSRVVIVAETVTYYGFASGDKPAEASASAGSATSGATVQPSDF